ncbi:MAG: hypothetical protein GXP25_06140 [Planctomycetes bacterium]|nr:hypothetical protein [Planctomycetota bacterium]
MIRCRFALALALFLGMVSRDVPGQSPIVRKLNTNPDGNIPRFGYVTGPVCGIANFNNGDVHGSFWNKPQAMTFSLGKNDVWDRRYFGDRKRIITLDDVKRICAEDDPKRLHQRNDLGIPNTAHALYSAYDFPCPKPVGQIIFRFPGLEGADEYSAGFEVKKVLSVKAAKGADRVGLRAFLHETKNLLAVRVRCDGITSPPKVQLYRHRDSLPQRTTIHALVNPARQPDYDYDSDPDNGPLDPPEAGTDGRYFWIRQRFPADKTFPNGFEYVLMARIEGTPCAIETKQNVANGGSRFLIHDVSPADYKALLPWFKFERKAAELVNAAPGSLATATIQEKPLSGFTVFAVVVTTRDAEQPMTAAKKQLDAAVAQGFDSILAEHRSVTEKQRAHWIATRIMRYNAFHPTYADATPWHGDYHFNEGYFLHQIVAGNISDLEPRLRLLEGLLPATRRNAREVYGCRGCCFPLVAYPIKSDRVVYASVTWELGIENTAFMLQPFWQIYQYTQDKAFLRERAYPMMLEGARFYADYVKKGDDGYYHVIPTVSQEHWGLTKNFKLNRDSVGALSFVKYHLKACIEASEILGVNADERKQWREIVACLAPYPTLQTDAGPVFCDVRDALRLLNYNITANLVMVLWAEDIHFDSPLDLLEMARRSYYAIPDREHSHRKGYLFQIRRNLGILEKPDLSPLGCLISWPGRIHLFPGIPKGMKRNASFSHYLAVGGFEVSASYAGTQVTGVEIRSRAGKTCRIANPWGLPQVLVRDVTDGSVVCHTLEGDTIVFPTGAGHIYRVFSPSEGERAKRYAPDRKLIAQWTFEKKQTGSNGFPAVLQHGAELVSVKKGKALKLNGKGAHARVERRPVFDFAEDQAFAVEACVKVEGSGADMSPILSSMDAKQYVLAVKPDGRPYFYVSSPRGDVWSSVVARSAVSDGAWHTVRAVRDVADGTLKIYIDGKLDGTAADTTRGDFSTPNPITIGAYFYGERKAFFTGLIDDVKIESLGRLAKE